MIYATSNPFLLNTVCIDQPSPKKTAQCCHLTLISVPSSWPIHCLTVGRSTPTLIRPSFPRRLISWSGFATSFCNTQCRTWFIPRSLSVYKSWLKIYFEFTFACILSAFFVGHIVGFFSGFFFLFFSVCVFFLNVYNISMCEYLHCILHFMSSHYWKLINQCFLLSI